MGKKITLYLVDNLPKGLRSVRIDQWIGKATCAPRTSLKKMDYEELKSSACVYFLVGQSEDGGLSNVYVGETDVFGSRVNDHDYKKDWWQEIIVFFSQDGSLTKTSAKYLECVCLKRLKDAGKCNIMNGNIPTQTTILQEDVSGLEEFFANTTIVLPLLGYDIFEQKDIKDVKKAGLSLFCSGKGAEAKGLLLEDGKLLVLKGSTAIMKNAPAFEQHNYRKLKDKLISIDRLKVQDDYLIFTDDYEFSSPSAAAAIILARSASGPIEWKNKEGKKLKDLI